MPTTISAASVVRFIVFFGASAAYFMSLLVCGQIGASGDGIAPSTTFSKKKDSVWFGSNRLTISERPRRV
jgi:hypothetical protein